MSDFASHKQVRNESGTRAAPATGCDVQGMQQLVTRIDPKDLKSYEAYLGLCERRVIALLLESQLSSQSDRPDNEVIEATARKVTRHNSGDDKFHEVRKAAGSVFC